MTRLRSAAGSPSPWAVRRPVARGPLAQERRLQEWASVVPGSAASPKQVQLVPMAWCLRAWAATFGGTRNRAAWWSSMLPGGTGSHDVGVPGDVRVEHRAVVVVRGARLRLGLVGTRRRQRDGRDVLRRRRRCRGPAVARTVTSAVAARPRGQRESPRGIRTAEGYPPGDAEARHVAHHAGRRAVRAFGPGPEAEHLGGVGPGRRPLAAPHLLPVEVAEELDAPSSPWTRDWPVRRAAAASRCRPPGDRTGAPG